MNTDEEVMDKAIDYIYEMMIHTVNGEAEEMNNFIHNLDKQVLETMSFMSFIICGAIHVELLLSK